MSEHNLPVPDDVPWLNLSKEEIEQLRKQKQELTQYGKEKIRELMNHEEMLSVAAQREAENKALEALDKLYDENGDALQQLSVIERQELINEALEELNAIVLGGQNTREFYLSVSHIRNVLERLK